jgi:hypothetical protein
MTAHFSWLGTGTSIKSGGVKLVLMTQASPLSEMMWSYECFLHVSIYANPHNIISISKLIWFELSPKSVVQISFSIHLRNTIFISSLKTTMQIILSNVKVVLVLRLLNSNLTNLTPLIDIGSNPKKNRFPDWWFHRSVCYIHWGFLNKFGSFNIVIAEGDKYKPKLLHFLVSHQN